MYNFFLLFSLSFLLSLTETVCLSIAVEGKKSILMHAFATNTMI